MIILSSQQLAQYQEATKISTEILWQLHQATKAGVTPLEIDALADKLCQKFKVKPNFKGVGSPNNLYRHATCISVNDVVVHGIPNSVALQPGDLVKVDFGLQYQGLNTDHCFTVGIRPVAREDHELLTAGRRAVMKAASNAKPGEWTGTLGSLMEETAHEYGFSVAEQYVGHGIGKTLHEPPELPAWGETGTGTVLRRGMVLCVEAQVIAGSNDLFTAEDGWSVKTTDGSKAVMFEYMVVAEQPEPTLLTPTTDWPLTV